jgi:hypothetical protein
MHLHDALDNTPHEPNEVLRLIQNQGEFSLLLDKQNDDDQVIEHEESAVMVVDPGISESLSGVTLDIIETPEGARLSLST